MNLKDGKPCFLSDAFYEAYPHSEYPEIEMKRSRPHVMFLVELLDGVWFAIPLRSNIRHKYRFVTVEDGGLDYSKAVPILDPSYIDAERKPYIRQSDWPVIRSNRPRIKRGMERYIRQYKSAKEHPERPGNALLIQFSTLKYFEKELGL